ncbi:MAG: ABC transporter permease [Agriterribacter sp.]
MFKNYFLIAIRSFKKDKTDTLISLSSLITGLAAVMLIAGYLNYSTQFETSYSNHSRIYRLTGADDRNNDGSTESVPLGLGPALTRDIPEVQEQTRIQTYTEKVLINNQYTEFKLSRVNNNFFSIFNFPFQQGNPETVLSNPNNIVLTASTAKRLFNTTGVIGKTFTTKEDAYIIAGIVEDLPQNSFLRTEAFCYQAPKPPLAKADLEGGYVAGNAFIFLNKTASVAAVTEKINRLCNKLGLTHFKIALQPVSRIHLYSSDIESPLTAYNLSDIKYIYVYGCIALLLLVIGCINFINLSIARNMERTMEMGIRKVMGAQKKQIVGQILAETGMYFLIAGLLALLVAGGAWKHFAFLSNIEAGISFMLNRNTLLILGGICLLSCLLSGLYPAVFLANTYPATALKKGYRNPKLNFSFRKALIAVQFTISIVLIIATIVVRSQSHYLNSKPLGFNKNNLVSFKLPFLKNYPQAFKNELLQNPDIQAVSLASTEIGKSYSITTVLKSPGDSTMVLPAAIIDADADFMNTLQVPILQGRRFAAGHPADMADYDSSNWTGADPRRPIIVSESLVKALQIKKPVGKILDKDIFLKGTIIGVSGDFTGTSFKDKTPLIAMRYRASGSNLTDAYTRINAANTAATIAYMSRLYKKYFPQERFDFSFIDERVASLYAAESRLTRLINIFAGLAIILLCAGLFSLVSLVIRKRTKEIGIRKILGASVSGLALLIGREFLWLILLAFSAGAPLAYMAMTKWLQGYAYRTDIHWWFFPLAVVIIFFIAFISVGIKSILAARANPAEALRTE